MEWLSAHGGFTVWLAGSAPRSDLVLPVTVSLPTYLTDLVSDADQPDAEGPAHPAQSGRSSSFGPVPRGGGTAGGRLPVVTYPPLAGIPRPDSWAEQALERALRHHSWAQGRRWNHTLTWHVLRLAGAQVRPRPGLRHPGTQRPEQPDLRQRHHPVLRTSQRFRSNRCRARTSSGQGRPPARHRPAAERSVLCSRRGFGVSQSARCA
jgi:hypothetical protein